MAKIHEQFIIIKLSALTRDDQDLPRILNDEIISNLQEVIIELVNDERIVIEIEDNLNE